jgi:hypothetical protein
MKTIWILFIAGFFALTANATKFTGYADTMINSVPVTIANGATVSSLVSLKGFALVGIQTPAALTGVAITFQSCDSTGVTCVPVKVTTSGTALSQTVTTSSYYAIDPVAFYGVAYLKLVSGSAEGGARALTVSLKGN